VGRNRNWPLARLGLYYLVAVVILAAFNEEAFSIGIEYSAEFHFINRLGADEISISDNSHQKQILLSPLKIIPFVFFRLENGPWNRPARRISRLSQWGDNYPVWKLGCNIVPSEGRRQSVNLTDSQSPLAPR